MSDLIKRLRRNWEYNECGCCNEAADALEKAQTSAADRLHDKLLDEAERKQNKAEIGSFKSERQYLWNVRNDLMDQIYRLESDLKAANARERPAFMAGVEATQHGKDFFDEEHAWQQYRVLGRYGLEVTE